MDAIVLDAPTDLATETASQLFLGRDHGVGVSFFMNHTPPGKGVRAHRHPYAEVFVVHDGEGTFTVDGVEHRGRGGHVIVVPPGAAHGFRNTGNGPLEMTSIHTAAEMETEWIEQAGRARRGGVGSDQRAGLNIWADPPRPRTPPRGKDLDS